jgi:hydroxylamine dehydrogenase
VDSIEFVLAFVPPESSQVRRAEGVSMRKLAIGTSTVFLFVCSYAAIAASAAASPQTDLKGGQQCIECHSKVTPNVVSDWKQSRHSEMNIACDSCHGSDHMTAADASKAKIPTPETCAQCHETQVAQFKKGKHSMAWASMEAMPTIHWQPMAMTEGMKGCGSCHKIGIKSPEQLAKMQKEERFGTASCDSCHTRHTFSVKEARSPQACETCHMGFDHPQWEMYSSSKHGVRNELKQLGVNSATSAAPTCQTCHMQEGNHEVNTAWGFLAVRLPMLPTSSGPPIAPLSCRRWGCSIRTVSPLHASTW